MILLRCTDATRMTLDFADVLAAASDLPVTLLIDETNGPVDASGRPKLSFNRRIYSKLGLYVPPDVGWRCGDYGFYLARQAYPETEWFWMIDYDVRLIGDARHFFELVGARRDLDLVVGRLQPADERWWWFRYLAASDAQPWRCFFPVVRLSARAVDVLHAKRRAQSRNPFRIAMWPNDEGFVATTVVQAGLKFADLNDLGKPLYDDETFSYENILRLDQIAPRDGPPELLHPVLSSEAAAAKVARMSKSRSHPDLPLLTVRQAVAPRINRRRSW